ncbi:MAG: hypothetical protein Q7R95_04150 [bacterium]|nr:hypothetical protein [bacterium]
MSNNYEIFLKKQYLQFKQLTSGFTAAVVSSGALSLFMISSSNEGIDITLKAISLIATAMFGIAAYLSKKKVIEINDEIRFNIKENEDILAIQAHHPDIIDDRMRHSLMNEYDDRGYVTFNPPFTNPISRN